MTGPSYVRYKTVLLSLPVPHLNSFSQAICAETLKASCVCYTTLGPLHMDVGRRWEIWGETTKRHCTPCGFRDASWRWRQLRHYVHVRANVFNESEVVPFSTTLCMSIHPHSHSHSAFYEKPNWNGSLITLIRGSFPQTHVTWNIGWGRRRKCVINCWEDNYNQRFKVEESVNWLGGIIICMIIVTPCLCWFM